MCYLYNLHPNHTVLHMLSGSVTYTNWLLSANAVISMSLKKRHLNDHTSPCPPPPLKWREGWEKELAWKETFSISLSPFPLTNFLKPSFDNSTFLKPFSINFYLSQSTAWESIFYLCWLPWIQKLMRKWFPLYSFVPDPAAAPNNLDLVFLHCGCYHLKCMASNHI